MSDLGMNPFCEEMERREREEEREELTRTVLRVEAERAAREAAWTRPMQNVYMAPATMVVYPGGIPEPAPAAAMLEAWFQAYPLMLGWSVILCGIRGAFRADDVWAIHILWPSLGAIIAMRRKSIGSTIFDAIVWIVAND